MGSMVSDFSHDELVKFEMRYDNGYDLLLDERYNLWLTKHHPQRAKELGLVLRDEVTLEGVKIL